MKRSSHLVDDVHLVTVPCISAEPELGRFRNDVGVFPGERVGQRGKCLGSFDIGNLLQMTAVANEADATQRSVRLCIESGVR